MTWFKVDDKFHSHSKIRKVLAEDPAAIALWAVAGSWSSDNLTDGFVPDHQLPWLIPDGAEQLARTLVAARLWLRVRGGFQFHEWTADGDGTKRNPPRTEVESERRKKAEAGRKGGLASAKTRSKPEARASATAQARASPLVEPPTRPDPPPSLREGGSGVRRASHDAARPPDNPDWRALPAFGAPREPTDAERVRRGAKAARAALTRPDPDERIAAEGS